jgi:uncharacterized membrane protein
VIFRKGTCKHLAIVRIWVFGILLLDLGVDDLAPLAFFPGEAFVSHGVMKMMPKICLDALLQPEGLRVFTLVYAAVLVAGLVGAGRAWLTTGLALILTAIFQGLARGFGGHVNHQELIVLFCLPFLIPRAAYSSLSVNALFGAGGADRDAEADGVARLMLRSICFWIFLTYFMIGMARIQTGKWGSYTSPAIEYYAYVHSLKWNYWDFSGAARLMEWPALQTFLRLSFPFATILELAAPLAVFRSKLTPFMVSFLIGFHLMILMFMNIFFWQNILLLIIPLLGWYIDGRPEKAADLTAPK